jgi:hypothetical protein
VRAEFEYGEPDVLRVVADLEAATARPADQQDDTGWTSCGSRGLARRDRTPSGRIRRVPRLRRAVILAVLALIAGGLAALAVADPFHLRYARWFTAGFVLLALLLATATFAVVARRGLARVLVLALGAVAVLGWVALVGLASQLTVANHTVSQVADGGRRLVVVEGAPAAIDPIYAVVLQAGSGPFEQETVIYQGVEQAPAPAGVRFVDSDTVEVRTSGGCLYRSEVEALTLAVDPVHRPLRADGC